MYKIFFILCAFFLLTACQQKEIIYDPYLDSFRHKPESEWDYLYLLEKSNHETKVAEK